MAESTSRRQFLKVAGVGGTVVGLGGMTFLSKLPPVSAQDANLNPSLVTLDSGIEPLVRVIEDTPREVDPETWTAA